ncbi:MAG: methylenetetrahydrofolate reductase C-terminal domain-containing protein, partial [Candidatus Hermodarchaeota archaeon]|nr:methylenetetrahydrofolate reductase C-terminal domain-containing protein [Candidatus Hermodarchaeota archaeon]
MIVGCDGCAGIYQVGGEKQAEVLSTLIEMSRKTKNQPANIRHSIVLRQCDQHLAATTLNQLVNEDDVLLSLACGVGSQTLAEVFPNNLVFTGVNTLGIGGKNRELGHFYEYCKGCGDCLLNETGGICPFTRCAKGLMNGPCGGMLDGKCEVGNYENECAWNLIYERLKEREQLDL